ncbi:MAG: phosphate signaling complex protein PhoU [Bacillota bacterium]|jgi:phosphate transport system protein|nr:phosphate signaling complex protein PhoU [Bacillota bacterium]HOF65703.1 phosphate signaling complex protein PhoU [Bacilli bacterium]
MVNIETELETLNTLLLRMCDAVIVNINEAMDFYLGKSKVESINDDLIDQYERMVEEMCINIMLKERLFARDLKETTGILKLVSDLERIGDHAEDILRFAKKLKPYKDNKNKEIESLLLFVVDMIKRSIKSYTDKNVELANEVISDDDYVDSKYLEIINALASKKDGDAHYLQFAIYTTLVVKYLERIADHSVNIAEWVVYIKSGYYKDKMIV